MRARSRVAADAATRAADARHLRRWVGRSAGGERPSFGRWGGAWRNYRASSRMRGGDRMWRRSPSAGDGGEEGPEQRGEWRRRSPEQSRRCSPAGGLVGRLEAPPARPAGWPHRELRGLRAVAVERRRSGFSISTPEGSSGRTASIRGGDDGWRKFRTVARRGAAGRRIALLRQAATRARPPAPPPRARRGGDYRRGSLGAHPATRRSPRSRDTGPRRPPRSQPTSGWLWRPKA